MTPQLTPASAGMPRRECRQAQQRSTKVIWAAAGTTSSWCATPMRVSTAVSFSPSPVSAPSASGSAAAATAGPAAAGVPGADGLKRVRWSGEGPGFFEVYCPGIGYNIVSTVTDCEDVSYVTSPYVPACLRECHWPPNTDVSRRPQPALVRLGAVRCLICGVCCAVSCCAVSCSAIFSEQSPLTCSEREPLSGGRGRLEHPRRTRRDDHSGVARDSNAGTSSCC